MRCTTRTAVARNLHSPVTSLREPRESSNRGAAARRIRRALICENYAEFIFLRKNARPRRCPFPARVIYKTTISVPLPWRDGISLATIEKGRRPRFDLSPISSARGRGNFGRPIDDICKLPRGGNLAPMDNKMVRIVRDINVYPTNS